MCTQHGVFSVIAFARPTVLHEAHCAHQENRDGYKGIGAAHALGKLDKTSKSRTRNSSKQALLWVNVQCPQICE